MTRDSELIASDDLPTRLSRAEAFLSGVSMSDLSPPKGSQWQDVMEDAIKAVREAASRLEAIGEPVAWRWRWKDQLETDGWCLSETDPRPGSTPTRMERFGEVHPLYALPNQGETKP